MLRGHWPAVEEHLTPPVPWASLAAQRGAALEKPKETPGRSSLSSSSPSFCVLMCAKGHTGFSRQHKVAALRSRTGSQCILGVV